jgi:mRNA-degrading endonuclease YafQ of YafQ-DinJ toxin-antitoxin module
MSKLKSIVDSLNAGETPKPKYLQAVYNSLQREKNEINKYIQSHYLKGITENPWEILVTKDVSRIYIKITVGSDDPEKVISELKRGNFYRLDNIGVYVKHLMKKANINPEDFTITHRLTRVGDTAGFTISIK